MIDPVLMAFKRLASTMMVRNNIRHARGRTGSRESTSSHHMSADGIIDTDIHAHLVPIRMAFDSQALTPFLGKEPCLDSQDSSNCERNDYMT